MDYLHYELELGEHDVVQVTLKNQAYIRLLDDENYPPYRRGKHYRYYGGLAQGSPANVKPPQPGMWHLCIDLGELKGELKATVNIIPEIVNKKKK